MKLPRTERFIESAIIIMVVTIHCKYVTEKTHPGWRN